MLSLEHISVQFGEHTLFDDITTVIGPHDRIGLVGSNGSGKSTLLKSIAGIQHPSTGNINKAHYVIVGYLPQDGVNSQGLTLYKEAEKAFEGTLEIQQKLNEAHDKLAALRTDSEDYKDTVEIIGELQHKLDDLDAYRMKSKIEQVLMGLGFSASDFIRMTDEFSGGWQMRIALAKLLLKEPNVLLLDEPTNHLDIESIQWLENYLGQYNGAVILVSHDRAFLDKLTSKTFSLSRGRFEIYNGNYSFYEEEHVVRRQLLQNQMKNQQQHIKKTQEFIERFRYKATKAHQVQSRIKQLNKLDMVEIENEEEEIHFRFPQAQKSGRVAMELNNVSKSYGEMNIFDNLNHKIERGDRIAIVGVNGAGKSTLSRIIAGTEIIDAGDRIIGHNTILSYFAQDQAEQLDLSKDILQTAEDAAGGETRTQLRTLLGSFLFHGDDIFKKVSVLSGGEKSRLALVKMLLRPANLLIMDEPTNHLDMRSKRILQEALSEYEGTFVIVSHDRAFLDPIVNKVLEVGSGTVRIFLGNLSDYIRKKKETDFLKNDNTDKKIKEGENRNSWQQRQEQKKIAAQKIKTLRKSLEDSELEIYRLEKRKEEIETLLADPDLYKNGEEAKSVSAEYKEVQVKLEKAYHCWSNSQSQLDKINKEDPS